MGHCTAAWKAYPDRCDCSGTCHPRALFVEQLSAVGPRQFAITPIETCLAGLCHCTAITPFEICFPCSCAVTQQNALQHCLGQKAVSAAQCCSANLARGRLHTPIEICSSCSCAVTQHQCTAALPWAQCILHCSMLLYKKCSGQACATAITPIEICFPCSCSVTQHQCTPALPWAKRSPRCSVLLCAKGSQQACGKMHCALLSAALHKLLEAGLVPLPLHLLRFAPHALQPCLGARCVAHCSVLLYKNCLRQACAYTYQDLLLTQLCSEATSIHCSTAFGTMHSSLLHAALQKVLQAGLCKCNHTYRDMLSMQLCSDPTPMHCSTALGKTQSAAAQCCSEKGSQQACVTAITPVKISCALTQDQCTAALPWAQCNFHCSVLLYKIA